MRRTLAVVTAVLAFSSVAGVAHAAHGTAGDLARHMTHIGNSPHPTATNSDLAFWGNLAYAGNYDGFRILDISDPTRPRELADFECPGAQSDVGVWDTGERRFLFTSVDRRQTERGCSAPDPTRAVGFEGLRIFDVTNPRKPFFIKGVPTDCGSHTHTVVPDPKNERVLVYVNSYPLTEQGVTAPDDPETDSECSPAHFKLSVVSVPYDSPQRAKVITEPSVAPAVGCHDVGVFLEFDLAAAACLTEGQIWDISDRARPKILEHIVNPLVNIWHSGSWTWDGRYAVFGDEEGGAAVTHGCTPPNTVPGATWFYDRRDPSEPAGRFSQRRAQVPEGDLLCTTHNYNVVPALRRYLLASAFYEAGTGVVDFTDVENAREIAYFDAQDGDGRGEADTWSSYFYNGRIYANDIVRGFDVFRPRDSRIAAARRYTRLNPQTQELSLFESTASNPCPGALTATRRVRVGRGPVKLRVALTQEGQRVRGAFVRVSGQGFSVGARTGRRGQITFSARARAAARLAISTRFCSGRLGVAAIGAPRFTG